MLASITSFLPRLRFTLLTATLLFVLSLNHQAVATFRLPAGKGTHVGSGPKMAVVKQKVVFEATATVGAWLAPALEAWLPAPALPAWLGQKPQPSGLLRPRPSAIPDLFRARLLLAALSPQAP
jgi:hypothetical protein